MKALTLGLLAALFLAAGFFAAGGLAQMRSGEAGVGGMVSLTIGLVICTAIIATVAALARAGFFRRNDGIIRQHGRRRDDEAD